MKPFLCHIEASNFGRAVFEEEPSDHLFNADAIRHCLPEENGKVACRVHVPSRSANLKRAPCCGGNLKLLDDIVISCELEGGPQGTEACHEQLLRGNLIESIAETSREDPFKGCFPFSLPVVESIAIYLLN
jgi:hypothetical protein